MAKVSKSWTARFLCLHKKAQDLVRAWALAGINHRNDMCRKSRAIQEWTAMALAAGD
jgi:hypothetical protein